MISKLPRWVWTGAWVLAFMAGMINAVGLLGFERSLKLCGVIISGFVCGGALGATVFRKMGYATLLVPSAMAAGGALLHYLSGQPCQKSRRS